jgi:RNA polymerase sigma factor (sigma-70 family)
MKKSVRKKLHSQKQAWSIVVEHQEEIESLARILTLRMRPRSFSSVVEDAKQVASLAAYKAALRFDSSRKVLFMTWARYYIWLYVRQNLLGTGLTGGHGFKTEMVSYDYLEYEPTPTVIEPDDPILLRERDRIVHELMAKLPDRLRVVAQRCLLEGRPYRQVGQELSISGEFVRRLRNRAMNLIQWGLWQQGLIEYCPVEA